MNYELIYDDGRAYVIECRMPVSQYTEREADTAGVDPESESASTAVAGRLDLSLLMPLRMYRPGVTYTDATVFECAKGDMYAVYIPYEEFCEMVDDYRMARPRDEERRLTVTEIPVRRVTQ